MSLTFWYARTVEAQSIPLNPESPWLYVKIETSTPGLAAMNDRLKVENVGKHLVIGVDDEAIIVEFLGAVVRSKNLLFAGFTSVADAFPVVKHDRPDLLFLDQNMPVTDGLEFCRMIRQEMPDYNVPIIFLTANDDEQHVRDAIQAGGNDYLVKPIVPQKILDRLDRWLPGGDQP